VIEVLENQGWVERDQRSKAFFLGRELMCLGYAAAQRHPIERIAEPHLARLAQETRQTIYLSVRSGFDAVCMARQEGGSPVQTVAQYVGARLPLGHGAGSLAFLAALPPEDAEEVITHNLSRYRKLNPAFEEAAFRRALDRARALGYARHHGLHVRGLSGIGIALGGDAPVAAISSAFVTDWLSEADQQCLANAMQDTARALARALGLTQERKEIERA
jgi:DNA-binding IclR family transcriptional regulator